MKKMLLMEVNMKSLHLSLDVKNFEKQKDKERGRREKEREREIKMNHV
jgi:hypothetical protein